MKEGGGPKAEQIVLNFFVPIRGGRVGVNEFRTKSPNFTIFFLKASLIDTAATDQKNILLLSEQL